MVLQYVKSTYDVASANRTPESELMSRILVPASGPDDWQRFLAGPERQWKTSYSARTLAYCWHAANGDLPDEIRRIFATSPVAAFHAIEPLLILPEYKVQLAGDGYASQPDIFVLAKAGDGALVSITVEGKVEESFDKPVGKWKAEGGDNRLERLTDLQSHLGLTDIPDDIYYQLVHRTAAAVIEARRFNAHYAVMLVHSFSKVASRRFPDYVRFLLLFAVDAEKDTLHALGTVEGVELFAGWVSGDKRFLEM